ncbi:class 1 fructose-bisphosphatase [Halarcobacter anaerophilus]|jgi:fructose-1,6-bisphosphatase I|uniref:Fructose-1,6-bisphosphatase class 1 n=1 Tax=Halarcobacter anaerophilus TaxID=877500 RepID=A0A4Q0Y0U4_9BACT|nr:class 1 fructose-bisphosphatase [Halarcobacter anaerophilus]QDF29024.1 fructose-1,6-bisphosphatase I [Halarcobacter anaerophilus]RXJ63657.1 class 1 fructose-bisphosphatase [Halarcobacter anaerophilus]
MNEILEAIKKASIEIKKVIDKGDTSKSTNENSTGDTQLKLDIASDLIIGKIFSEIPSIKEIVSEEQESIVPLHENGEYLIAYDPLDGSSLVDVNLSVGSIYGIYKNEFNAKNIIAAVYVVFGPRIEMVVALDNCVKMYRLHNGEFKYIKDVKLNEKGNLNATGSTQMCWSNYHKKLLKDMFNEGYYLRYSGGMVPDLHQILLKGGGLFSYPGTSDKPKGKLRQLFEVFPFALTYEFAGGAATDGFKRALEVETTHIHDTTPCFFGSKEEIKKVKEVYKEYAS